jgi:hypothetical protein
MGTTMIDGMRHGRTVVVVVVVVVCLAGPCMRRICLLLTITGVELGNAALILALVLPSLLASW